MSDRPLTEYEHLALLNGSLAKAEDRIEALERLLADLLPEAVGWFSVTEQEFGVGADDFKEGRELLDRAQKLLEEVWR